MFKRDRYEVVLMDVQMQGMNDYMAKPFNPDDLKVKLDDVLR